ncbi:RcpC/CpaB family pilus assembly protein [Streptomyces zaomyceticus]
MTQPFPSFRHSSDPAPGPAPAHFPAHFPAPPPTPSPAAPPVPSPVPAACVVPVFEPLRVRGTRHRLRRALRRARRMPTVLLALVAAALAVAGGTPPPGPPGAPGAPVSPVAARARPPAAVRLVSAPVRIADAATVRLLRPGDRVDVIAAPDSPLGADGEARVVVTGARVAEVPRPDETRPDGGALVVLSVPRSTAAALAGAGVTSQLALILC